MQRCEISIQFLHCSDTVAAEMISGFNWPYCIPQARRALQRRSTNAQPLYHKSKSVAATTIQLHQARGNTRLRNRQRTACPNRQVPVSNKPHCRQTRTALPNCPSSTLGLVTQREIYAAGFGSCFTALMICAPGNGGLCPRYIARTVPRVFWLWGAEA